VSRTRRESRALAFYVEAWRRGPTRLVKRALGHARGGRALDLGCGVGQDSIHLARNGFTVLAIDAGAGAVAFLRANRVPGVSARQGDLARIRPRAGHYDLVHASLSLPFVGPDRLAGLLGRVERSLRRRGLLSCHLFGVDHRWNRPGAGIAFVTRDQIEELLAGFRILELGERRPRGTSPHHLFEIIARRR
jgi:SAM-dependent methyltransferase